MNTMDCRECQGRFSDFLERALDPVNHQDVTFHLASCEACKASYRAFQRVVRSLGSVPREEVPPGLKEAVLAAIPAPLAISPVAARPARRRIATVGVAASWVAAAAAILAGCVLAIHGVQRDAWWQARLSDAMLRERTARETQESVALAQGQELEQRLGRLLQSLETESALRKSAEESNLVESGKRREVESALARLEVEARSKGERLLRLEKDLALARADQKQLSERTGAAEQALEDTRRAASSTVASLAVAAPEHSNEASEPPRRRSTILRESGGRLELSVRGPREQVLPELIAMARDVSNTDAAELALNALENLIPLSPTEPAASTRSGSWIRSRLDDVVGALGMVQTEIDSAAVPPSAESRRSARIEALERAWNEERNTQQE